MKSSFFLLLASCFLGRVAAKTTQTDTYKQVDDGKIVLHQIFHPSGTVNCKEEISSLRKEVEMLRKDLTHLLDKNETQDPWIKLNTAPVCFGAKGNQFGKFSVPSGGRLLAIKLVHMYGYVRCTTGNVQYWSYWGCGTVHGGVGDQVSVVVTTSTNGVLLPASQFITDSTHKWFRIPGYNSLSPELVLSVFSSPPTVTSGQVLRLWYGEDLASDVGDRDNDGTSCCDVFARLM
ncbi:uncharacterized protein LOC110057864 [Orbicella faveolata]|uniref:uncharacterized protein LOC110057864 n=1 Tax=Orbicella faveolata TaxID=48498 RepID=UPI0009E3435C|nr:uncharacterized protein LOC110057864 [Orbicella faveolata]